MRLSVKVVPKSSKNAIAGWVGEALKICVTAPPEKGKANAAVESVLAEALGVPAACVRVVTGHGSPRKVVEIEGMKESDVRGRLASAD
ncbi:MAG: DUF167 domain-containing protein [Nitrospirae bacterium]|nr:DUF167 domain-containing protein [Nitrospirota bacterium]